MTEYGLSPEANTNTVGHTIRGNAHTHTHSHTVQSQDVHVQKGFSVTFANEIHSVVVLKVVILNEKQ